MDIACTILQGRYNNRSYEDSDAQRVFLLGKVNKIFTKFQKIPKQTENRVFIPGGNDVIINYFSYI